MSPREADRGSPPGERGLGAFDTLLVCMLVGLMIAVAFPYYQRLVKDAKEAGLQSALANLRTAIRIYRALEGEYPKDLGVLVHRRFIIPIREEGLFSGEYLRAQAQDREGHLIDPFGNVYRYDQRRGVVASATQGYEAW